MTATPVPPIDIEAGGDYPDNLYGATTAAQMVPTLADIGPPELERFRSDGFLAVRAAIDPVAVADALNGLETLMMQPSGGADLQFEAWAADQLENLDATQRMD